MKLHVEFGAVVVTIAITILIMNIVHMSSFGGTIVATVAIRIAAATIFGEKLGRMPNLPTLHTS